MDGVDCIVKCGTGRDRWPQLDKSRTISTAEEVDITKNILNHHGGTGTASSRVPVLSPNGK